MLIVVTSLVDAWTTERQRETVVVAVDKLPRGSSDARPTAIASIASRRPGVGAEFAPR